MKRKILKFFCCVAAAGLLTGVAYAQSSESSFPAENNTTGTFASFSTLLIINGVELGYQFTPTWGVEGDVFSMWGTELGFDIDTATIYSVAMRGVLPLGKQFELFGKLGVGVINAQVKIYNIFNNTVLYNKTSEAMGPTLGVGLGYCFTSHWMLTAQYNGIYTSGTSILRSGFKGMPTVGITYHFAE